jgi:7,8-dihydropterin-6-yl-methyl-4-(beta-D-ribofuranosyl)aminobenzene 5'-phosphate synthase
MKLTILVDNNTFIDRYFYGEPGLSYFIQDGDTNILFDTGYSDIFIQNARKMNVDLNNINYVVISHGHNDHTWGLYHLVKLYTEDSGEKIKYNRPDLVAHPLAFQDKFTSENEQIGSLLSEKKLGRHFNMSLSKEHLWLTDKFVFLGEIERSNQYENKIPIGKVKHNGKIVDDYMFDDSALVYKSPKGLVIITGCSHSGICNIIEYAKKICKDDRIVDVIGGFHLLDPSKELLRNTCDYIKQSNTNQIHAGHCTDLKSKIELSKICEVMEIGVGLVVEYY